ncbi:hypothetical protein DBR42_24630 [Pelomonas sp. HMWF004]|nr:hypothetical protein DBR42_24630 [Pelomonas sp. HMWF004]
MDENSRSEPMKPVTFRLPVDEYELTVAKAHDAKMKVGEYIRVQLMLANGGFDEKQQSLLQRLDAVLEVVSRAERLSAIAVAAASLPKGDVPAETGTEAEQRLLGAVLAHIRYAGTLSDGIVKGVQTKKL